MTVQVIKKSVPMKKLFLVFLFICLGLKLGVRFSYGFTFDWNRFDIGIGSEFVKNCFMHLEAGNYERAIKEGTKAININPIDFFAHLSFGRKFSWIGQFRGCAISFRTN